MCKKSDGFVTIIRLKKGLAYKKLEPIGEQIAEGTITDWPLVLLELIRENPSITKKGRLVNKIQVISYKKYKLTRYKLTS